MLAVRVTAVATAIRVAAVATAASLVAVVVVTAARLAVVEALVVTEQTLKRTLTGF